jgi:hypothetical protein
MHRHDLFPLSLMELLLSSHSGIFYALIPFYTNGQLSGSAKIRLKFKAKFKASLSQPQSISIAIDQSQSISITGSTRSKAISNHNKECRLDRPDPYPVRRGGTLLERYF